MELGKLTLVFAFFAILSFSFASAIVSDDRTLVMGTVYNEDFSEEINSGVTIWFICNDDDANVQSHMLTNSSFAVTFPSSECPVGSFVDIGAYKDGYDFYGSGSVIHSCEESSYCLSGLEGANGSVNVVSVAITNVNMKKSSSDSSGGDSVSTFGSGRLIKPVFNNTKANVTEPVVEVQETPEENAVEEIVTNDDTNQIETSVNETTQDPKGLSGITGNFLASGASSWIAVIVILVATLIVYLLLKKKSKVSLPAQSTTNAFY